MSSSLDSTEASAPRSRLMSITSNTRIGLVSGLEWIVAGESCIPVYSAHAATVLAARFRGDWCREIMRCERGRLGRETCMVANVLPLGCPLPRCQGRMCDPHPSLDDRTRPAAPNGWPRRATPQNPRRDPVQLVIASMSRRVTSSTVCHQYYCVYIFPAVAADRRVAGCGPSAEPARC